MQNGELNIHHEQREGNHQHDFLKGDELCKAAAESEDSCGRE